MSVQLLSYNAPIDLSRSYNPVTKRVSFSYPYPVEIRFVKYTSTSCSTTPANWRGRMYLGCVNGVVGSCGSDSQFPNMSVVIGVWDSTISKDRLVSGIAGSIDGKTYNTYVRGKDWAWRGYDYSYGNPSACSYWKIYTEPGGYAGGGYCAGGEVYWQGVTISGSEPPLPPEENPTITSELLCVSDASFNRIVIESPNTTNVEYFSVRKASGLTATYVEVAKLYVSGGTFYYDDTTGVDGYYKVYACNSLYDNDYPSNIVEIGYAPIIEAHVVWGDYPTLTFTAQTTNFCADIDNVLWYLDGELTGTTTGNTFTSVLPTADNIYQLTAKYVKGSITGSTSNIVQLIFFYTGTTLSGFTSNGNMVIPNYFNRMTYLIVAGGGGGGAATNNPTTIGRFAAGGGGGAGGMLEGTIINPIAGTYPVVIGSGGGSGTNGGSSSFYGMTASGGGKGGLGKYDYGCANGAGGAGGGGGGGGSAYYGK